MSFAPLKQNYMHTKRKWKNKKLSWQLLKEDIRVQDKLVDCLFIKLTEEDKMENTLAL